LKPEGIVVGGFDTNEQKVAFDTAAKAGTVVVGWHSGTRPGPEEEANIYANVTTDPKAISETAADQAINESGGKAGVVIFTDTQYEIAVFKARAMEAAIKKCGGCTVLEFVDSPIAESSQRMPQLTTTLLQKYGTKWTHSLAINDLYFDFMGPSLASAGIKGDGAPRAISAGDGSESAFQRIASKQYQAGTVPEPLTMQGWQLVDELNRAFNKKPWSGYVSGIHLVTADNVAYDGGDRFIFDPDNGYRDQYKKIWGVK
jgi:ribose transport system substrate-binding protein